MQGGSQPRLRAVPSGKRACVARVDLRVYRLHTDAPRFAALVFHELTSKRSICLVLIVRTTAKSQIACRGWPSEREGNDVVEFEAGARFTSMTVRAYERALIAVSITDGSFCFRRNMATRCRAPLPGRARSIG